MARLRRRALAAACLGALTRHAALALFAGGVAVLFLRSLGELGRERAALALALVLLAPVTAFLAARRRLLSERGAGAWLDVRTGGSGLVVAALESGDGSWTARAEDLARSSELPRLRLARLLAPLAPALLFAACALWIDVSRERPGPPRALYEAALERIDEKLLALEEELLLEDERAAELRAREQRLREEIEAGARPEAAFEALDRLERQIAEIAAQVADGAETAAAALDEARALALSEDAERAALATAFGDAMRQLAAAGFQQKLSNALADSLQQLGITGLELPEGFELSPGAALELSAELLAGLEDALARLDKAGLLKPGKIERFRDRELAHCDPAEASCDSDCEGDCDGGSCASCALAALLASSAGTGGIDRGPGPADLTLGEPSPERSGDFASVRLPPARLFDPDHSQVLAIGAAEPQVDPLAGSSGLTDLEASPGTPAWRRRLAPRHRDVVKTFFSPDR